MKRIHEWVWESELLSIFDNDCPKKIKKPARQENIKGHGLIVIISALTVLGEGLCQTWVT